MLNIQKTIKNWANLTPKQILASSVKKFGEDNLAFACSFSAEDVMLLDIIQKNYPKIDIFTLDTGRLPNETYELWSELLEKYPKLKITPFIPNTKKLENFIFQNGPNAFYKDIALRKECCNIRKIEGLKRATEFKKAFYENIIGDIYTILCELSYIALYINFYVYLKQERIDKKIFVNIKKFFFFSSCSTSHTCKFII